MLTVTTIYKTGQHTRADYVVRLKNGAAKLLKTPHRFICLTDDRPAVEAYGVATLPLSGHMRGEWARLEYFRPYLLSGQVIALDLECLTMGDLSPLVRQYDGITMAQDFRSGLGHYSPAVMSWRGDMGHIWDAATRDFGRTRTAYERRADRRNGPAALISDLMMRRRQPVDLFGPDVILNYAVHDLREWKPRKGAVVVFDGPHKPWAAQGWPIRHWNELGRWGAREAS